MGSKLTKTMGSKLSRLKKSSKEHRNRVVSKLMKKKISSDSKPQEEEKCYDPRDPSLVFVDADDDMDFELDNFKSLRALMSCGHVVTPISLTNWCRRQLDQGETEFECGVQACGAIWPFEEVCKMALLTPEEIEYFEKKMFDNTKDCYNVKSCPGCKSTVLRSDLRNLCVACTVCEGDTNRPYEFCWQCLREWRGPSPRSDRCDNEGCSNEALETLKNCPEMIFKDVEGIVGCPSIRACPCCGFLVEHDRSGCKYVYCTRCKLEFCFMCLEDEDDCLETSDPFTPCSVGLAPRQTYIPVLAWDDDHKHVYDDDVSSIVQADDDDDDDDDDDNDDVSIIVQADDLNDDDVSIDVYDDIYKDPDYYSDVSDDVYNDDDYYRDAYDYVDNFNKYRVYDPDL